MGLKLQAGASVAVLFLCTGGAFAQTPARVTEADYARAERMLGQNTGPLVDHAVTGVKWLDDGHFVYFESDANGMHLQRMDAATGKAAPAFDHVRMGKALSAATGKPVDARRLDRVISGIDGTADGRLDIAVRDTHYLCDAVKPHCVAKPAPKAKDGDGPGNASPDGKREAFIRDWNLWVRELPSGKETQLTTDGIKDFGYATNNAGWVHDDSAILVWSPDSSKIATFQQDQRKTGEMTLVSTKVGHPDVQTWKYPLVGDKDVTMIERVVIDVPTHSVLRLKTPPDQHRSTQCDDVSCFGGWEDVQWAKDGKTIAFASTSRDHTKTWVRIADVATGAVRDVFQEDAKNWFESGINAINWRYLSESNEILWWSQRSNWGHLYVYDATNGKLKHQVTKGDWNVAELLRLDTATRTAWFTGVGREEGHHPYHQHLYRVNLDSGEPVLLSPEDAQHTFRLSPDGTRVVDTYSTTAVAPVTVLRDANDGKVLAQVAQADLARLKLSGWVAPEPIVVKARDGKTDLYGMLFKPSNFDPNKKYPIINYVYPGPQVGSVRSYGFLSAHGDNQALAELGFVVVAIDGMGTPYRSKAFHDGYAKNIGDNTLPDQVAGMKQLAARYPWIDLSRVGIWGHSGGGNATGTAMFRYGDFFKVGIAESGNHDNRNYEDDWAEKWQGLLVSGKDGKSNYDDQANQNHASGLKGHLLLIHGLMDDNVPPSSTLLVVDALIKANKDFDLLLLPNARHGYGEYSLYVMRKRWDYFVDHLLGAEHPAAYAIKPAK
ncbi:dipeptidyl peptidase IV [Lysobacter helvus]|uniref:Dipeptidyl peptidase IV n=2 Tax=Lysobacteraceae TaxID=32033 RepID=A0ABM7Q4F2_9GAMM|nr:MULTISPECIES: S9 family peptidase [Lysobacter]BCT92117.1 dipeptidyl peptidase IV [Lysobacter caseinilyticus]BCT95270.1 dipeptidyl peptidase IV [Lysobacter helvus]